METIGNAALAGRCLVVGIASTVLDGETARSLLDLGPAGVILFYRNLHEISQIVDLMEALRNACSPALVCIDQEGGLVDRLRAVFPRFPSVEVLADLPDNDVLYRYGKWTGEILRAFGFNVNFAPVVDLKFHNEKNALQQRYLGRDPEKVGVLALRYLEGLQSEQITGCAKHFPGLGRARLDSHYQLPEIEVSLAELRREDLVPYQAVRPALQMVMLNHATYPLVRKPGSETESNPQASAAPASCSHSIYSLLREELGFRGIAVTDDLDMRAVHEAIPTDQIPLRAFDAGADLLIIGENLDFARLCRDRLAASFEDAGRRTAALQRTAKLTSITEPPRVAVSRIPDLAATFSDWKRSLGLEG